VVKKLQTGRIASNKINIRYIVIPHHLETGAKNKHGQKRSAQ